ncbi:MAG TPA: MOSC domain-containing protein [Blastocatellia bacterium]|nr:MOSC domain-containing protein [Blastocatellia bacterium]
MKVISVNVGLPREVMWKGKTVTTGIFKEPVAGRVALDALNFAGDRQADLRVHGGPDKAVYVYPVEHYDYWRGELPGVELPFGAFGENLTVEGLLENEINIGDRFRIGTAELVVRQPRLPCYKLAVKFQRDDIIKRFLDSRRTGFYFAVIREGDVSAGDQIEILSRDPNGVTVPDIVRLYLNGDEDLDGLARAANVDALPDNWKTHFADQLEKLRA